LFEAVTIEINRRNQENAKNKGTIAPVAGTSGKGASVSVSDKTTREIDELPEGKANLIRASFRAGIKPVAIARTFRISQSLVNRVLNSIEKPKR
jgi:DNA invertase Pin-like site-specific DNA recombinase